MLDPGAQAELIKQQYRLVGNHSSVKVCGWTKNMLRGRGTCYKWKFYGIRSHQCLQMSSAMSCANRCVFCWRGYKAPVSKEWTGEVDDPEVIIAESLEAHKKLLYGFKDSATANQELYQQSTTVKHVALSLTGEPIIYPRMNELVDGFHKRGISTFIVTNGQYPDAIRDLSPITQLYLSMDAPTKELMKQVDVPLFSDYWERYERSLDELARKKQRTAIRITLVKGINDNHPAEYAALIRRGDPTFVEVKAYMFVGASRQRLQMENMPLHDEVMSFTNQVAAHLPEYEIVSEHKPSRVVMLAKKQLKIAGKWHTWIDFEKFSQLAQSGKPFTTMQYLALTPDANLR